MSDSNYQKEYSYNSYGEVTQIKDNTLTVNLTRNKLSQIVRKEEITNNKTITYEYVYDKLGRLTKVTKDGETVEEYTYDENSNRISAKVNGKSINATYNKQDQLISYNNTSYSYDNNGNLIKKENDTKQTTYTYDDFNNLKAVTLPNNKTISYITNPLNQRVAKLVNGEIKEKYLWKDLTTLLAIYDKDNNLIYRFEYANGRMPVSMTDKNNNRYYLHYDQVGSLRAVTDTNGNIIKEITYDSYGNIISDTNPNFKVTFGFAGGLYDPDTKLVHFGYREYDPVIGRWLSKDPLLFGGGDSNLYGYVLQDPVNLVDPSGLLSTKQCKKLKEILAYEKLHGTKMTARRYSATWGEPGYKLNTVGADRLGGDMPIPSSIGYIDLDWYLDLASISGPTLDAAVAYPFAKTYWNIYRGYPLSNIYEPKESRAINALVERKTLNDLFGQTCPSQNKCSSGSWLLLTK